MNVCKKVTAQCRSWMHEHYPHTASRKLQKFMAKQIAVVIAVDYN